MHQIGASLFIMRCRLELADDADEVNILSRQRAHYDEATDKLGNDCCKIKFD